MAEKVQKKSKSQVFTAANIVTIVRIVLVPVFFLVLRAPWPAWFPYWENAAIFKPWLAAIVFGVLSATDGVDGYLARSRDEITTLGKFLDPIADKILVCAALLALVELGKLPSWIALVIVAREFIVSGLRMVASAEGMVIAASWYGKWKTFLTLVALAMFIVKDSQTILSAGRAFALAFQAISWTIMIAALVLTIVSMVDYFAKANSSLHLFSQPTLDKDAAGSREGGTQSREDGKTPSKAEAGVGVLGGGADGVPADAARAASALLESARAKGLTVATAESCTGGLVSGALTEVPGSSDIYMGGVVSYSNAAKHKSLAVSQEDLDEHGAVSHEVAEAMALGAAQRFSTDVAVSITGVAGPGGGSAEKPVGTVWFGLAVHGEARSELHRFDGDRAQVRAQSVLCALKLLQEGVDSL